MLGPQQLVQVALYAVLALIGILSFFSPAVVHSTSSAVANRPHGLLHVIAFAVGSTMAIMVLGYLSSVIGAHITAPRLLVVRIAGVGIVALGVLEFVPMSAGLFQRELMLPTFRTRDRAGSSLNSLYLGVRLILGWVPSFSPIVLAMLLFAVSANSVSAGLLSTTAFTVGFLVALLASRLAARQAARVIGRHVKSLRIWMKVCGVGLVVVGFMVLTGWMNGATDYLSPVTIPSNETTANSSNANSSNANANDTANETSTNSNITTSAKLVDAPDLDLVDQFGIHHKLSDYEGTIVVLVFWSTESKASISALGDLQSYYADMIVSAQKEEQQELESQDTASGNTANTSTGNLSGSSSATTATSRPAVTVFTVVMSTSSESATQATANLSNTVDSSTASGDTSVAQQRAALLASFASSSESSITSLLATDGYTFPVLFDGSGASFEAYGVDGLPKTYVITTDGRIAGSVTGALTADQFKRIVDEGIATETASTSTSNTATSSAETTNAGA